MSDSGMAGQGDTISAQDDVATVLAGYRPLPGLFDEMEDRGGRVGVRWRPLAAMLAALGRNEIGRRFAAADRHLHDSGVFYRVYEDAAGVRRRASSPASTRCMPGMRGGGRLVRARSLDPTNGTFAGDDHIVLAIGRDYGDVAPIDGVIYASGQRLEVSVSVTPVG